MQGIFPVLATAVIILTPVFTWSTTFRTHRARVVILYWAVLVYVALFIMMFLVSDFKKRLTNEATSSYQENFLFSETSFAFCNSTDPACSIDALNENLNYENFQACNCIDFCALLSPFSPLRNGQNMVANIGRNSSNSLIYDESTNGTYAAKPLFIDLTIATQFVLSFALLQGLIALLQGSYTQKQVRDWIFRVVSMKGHGARNLRSSVFLSAEQQGGSRSSRGRFLLGKILAAAYYLMTIVTLILYLPVFVLTIAVSEILVADYPESEHSDSIGAWTPWLSVGLIASGALILNFHNPVTHAISGKLKVLFCCAGHRRLAVDDEKIEASQREGHHVRSTAWESALALFTHSVYDIRMIFWRAHQRMNEFRDWWKNPYHNYDNEAAIKLEKEAVQDQIDSLKAELAK